MTLPVKLLPVRTRGRPRSAEARAAILRAARALLDDGGIAAVTMEGVASRAGVGKPTVYRWWPDRHAVARAALMEAAAPAAPARRSRSALPALQQQLQAFAQAFSTTAGRNVAMMIAASDGETELSKAFRNHFVLARREEGRVLLREAIANGELRRGLDIDAALDLLFGPLFFRLLMGHAPLDAVFVKQLFKDALLGLQSRARR